MGRSCLRDDELGRKILSRGQDCAGSDVYSPALTTNSAKPEIERHMAFVTQREDSTGNEISLRFEFVSCSLASG